MGSDAEVRELTLAEVERDLVIARIKSCRGNMSRAARSLGMDRRTIYRKLDAYHADGHLTAAALCELRYPRLFEAEADKPSPSPSEAAITSLLHDASLHDVRAMLSILKAKIKQFEQGGVS